MSGTAKSSGLLGVATTLVMVGKGMLSSVQAISDGTNAATVTVYDYDSASASGDVLAKVLVPGAQGTISVALETPIRYDLGLVVVVSGTGAGAIVGYGA